MTKHTDKAIYWGSMLPKKYLSRKITISLNIWQSLWFRQTNFPSGPFIYDVSLFFLLFWTPSSPVSANVRFLDPHYQQVSDCPPHSAEKFWNFSDFNFDNFLIFYQYLMLDYACRCQTSTLIMIPTNFWRNSDTFETSRNFGSKFFFGKHHLSFTNSFLVGSVI